MHHSPAPFGHKCYHMNNFFPPEAPTSFITFTVSAQNSESYHVNQVQVKMRLLGYSSLSSVPLDLKTSWPAFWAFGFNSLSHSSFSIRNGPCLQLGHSLGLFALVGRLRVQKHLFILYCLNTFQSMLVKFA